MSRILKGNMAWGGWKAHNGSEFIVRGCMIKTKSKHLKKTRVHLQREVSAVPFNKWCREDQKRDMPQEMQRTALNDTLLSEQARWCLLGARCYSGHWQVFTRMSGKLKDMRNRGLPTWLLATQENDFLTLYLGTDR